MVSFFFECAKLFLFLKLLILLFTFDSGKKSRRLSIRFKRLSMVEIPRYSLRLPKMLLANIFSLFGLNTTCNKTYFIIINCLSFFRFQKCIRRVRELPIM